MRWHPLSGRPWKEYNGEKTSRSTVDRREQQYAATVSIRCVAWSHSSRAATSRSGPSIFSPRAATASHLGPEVHRHHPCPELGRLQPSPLYMGDPSFQPRMLTGGTAANGRGPWPSTETASTASSSTLTPTPSTAAARIRQIWGNEVTTHLTFKGMTPSSRGKCQDEETPLLLLDMILAADSSASDLIRGIATECGVEFDEDPETMVIDHINYASTEVEGDHTLIAGDDLIQSDVILGYKKIELEIRLVKMSSTQDMLGLLCDQRERR